MQNRAILHPARQNFFAQRRLDLAADGLPEQRLTAGWVVALLGQQAQGGVAHGAMIVLQMHPKRAAAQAKLKKFRPGAIDTTQKPPPIPRRGLLVFDGLPDSFR